MLGNIAVLVLAAGSSSRFGSCKLLAEYQGKALLRYALDAARSIAPERVYLLTGAWHQTLLEAEQSDSLLKDVQVLHHRDWAQGMGSSIAKGVAHLPSDTDAVLIMLADQPLLTIADYQQLIAQLDVSAEEQGSKSPDISCAFYANKRGAPALLKSACFADLIALSGDRGAKQVLYDTRYKTVELKLEKAAIDIDHVQTLAQLQQLTSTTDFSHHE